MVFPWFFHGVSMVFPWFSHGFAMVSPEVFPTFPCPRARRPHGPAPEDAAAVVVAAVQDAHLELFAVAQLEHLKRPMPSSPSGRLDGIYDGIYDGILVY